MNIGIDIGGSHIGIGAVNENGKIVKKYETDLDNEETELTKEYEANLNDKETELTKEYEANSNNKKTDLNNNIADFIENYIIETIKEIQSNYTVDMIGVASPGTPKNGKITTLVNLGLNELDITNIIQKVYNGKIIVKNDAKCAGLAEKTYGSLNKYKDSVFLCLGTGIGGSVFIDGKQLEPTRFPGFEIGHMIIQKDGKLCNCGKKGCFETYCSIKRLKKELENELNLKEEITAKDLLEILKSQKQNVNIQKILKEYIENLIVGLSNIIDIFEPEAIALGGSFVYFEDVLYNDLLKIYNERKYVFNKESLPELKLAVLGNDAGIIGAASLL